MHIDRDALYREWEPKVKERAARKAKSLKRKGCGIVDANTIEGEALCALKRATEQWQGAGPFESYLWRAVRNAWQDDERRERRHRHAEYLADSEDGCEPCGDIEPINEAATVFRVRRNGFRGGDSVVLLAVIRKEQAEALMQGGLPKLMKMLGCTENEVKNAVRQKNRRVQQHERRHPEGLTARQQFEKLFT